jgi:hypothetical protein
MSLAAFADDVSKLRVLRPVVFLAFRRSSFQKGS